MGKKSVGRKAALAESFIQFQIQVKRKETEEFKDEIRELEAKNRKLFELHDQLRKEYLDHICLLRKQVKEQEKELEQREVFSKGQVAEAVQQNLELANTQEEELADLHRQLTGVQGQVAELQVQRKEYVRSSEHQQQIQNLQSEHVSMQKDLQEMPENMKRSLNAALSEIDKQTSQQIDEKKQLAIEGMLNQMDTLSCHEFKENGWLKAQLAIYRSEVSVLDTAVWSLEEENLKHLREQFEHHLSQLPISRNMQAAGLGQTDSHCVEQPMQELKARAVLGSEPFSPCDSAVEAGDETDPSCRSSSPLHNFSMLLYGSERELGEPLHLDSLAKTLLTVVGQAMTLNVLPSDTEVSSMSPHLDLYQAQNQPLTSRIIRNKFQ